MTSMMGKRRTFVVHRGFQVRMALFNVLTTGVVITLLVLLNLTFAANSREATDSLVAKMPQLGSSLHQMDRRTTFLMVLISVLVTACVFVLGILRSHRIAGAAFSLHRSLDSVAGGRYATQVNLRRRDDLQELGDAFNRMSGALTRATRGEIETLETLLSRLRSDDSQACRAAIEAELIDMIRRKERRLHS
jgi:nitrogen fixation/metabolism regulation signal transduction histidine kinase